MLVGDGLTAVVLGQAAPDAMGLVGGERVERARHPDGTPRTDRLGRRLPLTPRGSPLAIRPKEQRTREVPACGVASPGPRPGPATPGLLLGIWRDLLSGWCWSASPARRTSGRPGHANLPGLPPTVHQPARGLSVQECIDFYVDFCQGSARTVQRADAWRPTATDKERPARSEPGQCPIRLASRSLLGRQPAACPARSAGGCAGRHGALLQAPPGQRRPRRRVGHVRSAPG